MKAKLKQLLILVMSVFLWTSCTKDDHNVIYSEVQVALNYPSIEGEFSINKLSVKVQEANSGTAYDLSPANIGDEQVESSIPYGTYIATIEGEVTVSENGTDKVYLLRAYKPNIVVNAATSTFSLDMFLSDPDAKFVFKEIFFTGTVTPEEKTYNGDKYIVIHNNSADTLYADGLIIAQSSFLTTTKRDYSPDVMGEAFTSAEIVMIPGSGKDYPIYPGKQFVVANNAINHKEYNTNSLDLTNADFEIELVSAINVDNPAVTNTISLAGNFTMHNRGFRSFVIAKLPDSKSAEDFLAESAYVYSYIAANGRKMEFDAYKIPNSYIIDAVNLSVEDSFEWIVTAPTLDMGWTYCGKIDGDKNRYGKSVTRKVLSSSTDGRITLQDTDNSTNDFNAETSLSLK